MNPKIKVLIRRGESGTDNHYIYRMFLISYHREQVWRVKLCEDSKGERALQVRRVVTGHDDGRAVVKIDQIVDYAHSLRPNHSSFVAWATDGHPIDNSDPEDGRFKSVVNGTPGSTILRVVEYRPGVVARRHRTNSLDYAIVMSGEIDMELDEGEVHLKAGDILIQRGTIHNWINRGSEPCVIAFVLIAANPVLEAQG